MIFDNLQELNEFRSYIHSTPVMRNVDHTLRHNPEKYDYVSSPKLTGYRGIHDVYRHLPRGHRREQAKKPWDGLLVEIQYRTRAQHAWATAVEISDQLDGEQTKFELEQSERGLFFSIASEIIARQHEGIEAAHLGLTTDQLHDRLNQLESKLGIIQRLRLLKQLGEDIKLKKHNVLNIFQHEDGQIKLEVIPFTTAAPAIKKATELENSSSSLNAVYVSSDNPQQLRSAYRNYFYDPVDFVELIESL